MLRFLEHLDRRWIFLLMGILVLIPLIFPLSLPIIVSARVRGFHDAIARIPDGSTVLMSCDYDPAALPELGPMTRTAMNQLFDKHCKIVVTCLWETGAGIVETVTSRVAEERGARYGVDWVDLGFKQGREAVMVLMGQGILNAYPRDYHGTDTRTIPILKNVRDYSSFPILVNISAGYPGTKEWVQQVGSRFHLEIVSGTTAVSAPEYYPYLQSGQLKGLLGGMAGAAEYEKVRNEKGQATRGMDAQSMAHVFVAICILLGNWVQWSRGRRTREGA
jgi:hypothetical protein